MQVKIRSDRTAGAFASMEEAALAGARVCGLQANVAGFLTRFPAAGARPRGRLDAIRTPSERISKWGGGGAAPERPRAGSLHVAVSNADAALAGMDSGLCEVAVVTADEWALRSKQGSNCNKLVHDGVLFEKENAYAVRGVPLYDSTFSRAVCRLYGGAKGLVVWY
jgi:hypothetical protein